MEPLGSAGFCGPALICPDHPELTITIRGTAEAAESPGDMTPPSVLCRDPEKSITQMFCDYCLYYLTFDANIHCQNDPKTMV